MSGPHASPFILLTVFTPAKNLLSCLEDAKNGLRAVAEGSYSLSLSETIPKYAYGARYTNKQGRIIQEIYKGSYLACCEA